MLITQTLCLAIKWVSGCQKDEGNALRIIVDTTATYVATLLDYTSLQLATWQHINLHAYTCDFDFYRSSCVHQIRKDRCAL